MIPEAELRFASDFSGSYLELAGFFVDILLMVILSLWLRCHSSGKY
jgi:hypothetical protein